ncbi:MAG TPA: imidazole glycerol phosphate synthase cyclase subunit [Chryseosolibacter sp.]
MSKTIRIIPRLDIKGPNVVKGIHLEGLRVMGRPDEFAKYYYETGADELMFMDVVASLYERNSLHSIISETAKKIFIPLTVGGGLRTLEDIKLVLRAGADKVCLNTAAIKNPNLISEAALRFGSSTIVVAIEAIRQNDGRYLAYTDNGREYTGVEVFEWAKKVTHLGAGELVITSVDKEGTGDGFDIELVKKIAESVNVPVIAHGGAGKSQDVFDVIHKGNCDAVTVASVLHYDFLMKHHTTAATTQEGNTEFLKSKRAFHNFKTMTITELKNYLIDKGISCRPPAI